MRETRILKLALLVILLIEINVTEAAAAVAVAASDCHATKKFVTPICECKTPFTHYDPATDKTIVAGAATACIDCSASPTSPINQIVNGANNGCIKCSTTGEIPNAGKTACEACAAGSVYASATNTCTACAANQIPNTNTPPDACITCGTGKAPNSAKTACECTTATDYDKGGVCTDCSSNAANNRIVESGLCRCNYKAPGDYVPTKATPDDPPVCKSCATFTGTGYEAGAPAGVATLTTCTCKNTAGTAITNAAFTRSAGCTCDAGYIKYVNSGNMECLQCQTANGYSSQCTCNTVKGMKSASTTEVVTTQVDSSNPFCHCNTATYSFLHDNTATPTKLEGCFCEFTTKKLITLLSSGSYKEATAYDSTIDYTKLTNPYSISATDNFCECKTYQTTEADQKNLYHFLTDKCELCYIDGYAGGAIFNDDAYGTSTIKTDGFPDLKAAIDNLVPFGSSTACTAPTGYYKSTKGEVFRCQTHSTITPGFEKNVQGVKAWSKAIASTVTCGQVDGSGGDTCAKLRDASSEWAVWSNDVCRPATSDGTVIANANCIHGYCTCNEDYYASEGDGES